MPKLAVGRLGTGSGRVSSPAGRQAYSLGCGELRENSTGRGNQPILSSVGGEIELKSLRPFFLVLFWSCESVYGWYLFI